MNLLLLEFVTPCFTDGRTLHKILFRFFAKLSCKKAASPLVLLVSPDFQLRAIGSIRNNSAIVYRSAEPEEIGIPFTV